MNALIVTPDRDSRGRRDFTGAFLPEALAFAKHHGFTWHEHVKVKLDTSEQSRRMQLLTAIEGAPRLDLIAVFAHGLMMKLPQLGWSITNVADLARAVVRNAAPDIRIVLYACSAAAGLGPGGDLGFADELRDELVRVGAVDCQVDAHYGAGHTTQNPRVRRFLGTGSGRGGTWIVEPESPGWPRWVHLLKGTLRFDFPLRSLQELRAMVL